MSPTPSSRPPFDVIRELADRCNAGGKLSEDGFIAGGVAAAHMFDKPYGDIDMFHPSPESLVSTGQLLLNQGFSMEPDHLRRWQRWRSEGMGRFHTNSILLESVDGSYEVNLVYKTWRGNQTTSLSSVLETFDFGHLAGGFTVWTDEWQDFRDALFPRIKDDAYPLMERRRREWMQGFFSPHQGKRQPGRILKNRERGYDLTRALPVFIEGYRMCALHYSKSFKEEHLHFMVFYEKIADALEQEDWTALQELVDTLDDPRDLTMVQILESLE